MANNRAVLGTLCETVNTLRRWRGIVRWRSLFVVAAIDIMHRWPGRSPVRRAVRLFCRHRRFRLILSKKRRLCIEGRYDEYADFHAICEIFVDRVYDVRLLSASPTMILDVGGHIGTFSLLAGEAFPEASMFAFEPDAQNCSLLERNVKDNNLKITVKNLALADYKGSTLLEGPSSMGRRIGAKKGARVQVQRLSEVVQFAPGTVLLMKIDVEGAEWRILEDCAATLPEDTFIFIETHNGDTDVQRLLRFSTRWGFQHEVTTAKAEYHDSVLLRGFLSISDKNS